jgi:hypothetical protein
MKLPGISGKYRHKRKPLNNNLRGLLFFMTSGYKTAAKLRLPEKKKGIANKIENG